MSIQTYDGLVYWRLFTSLGLNDFNTIHLKMWLLAIDWKGIKHIFNENLALVTNLLCYIDHTCSNISRHLQIFPISKCQSTTYPRCLRSGISNSMSTKAWFILWMHSVSLNIKPSIDHKCMVLFVTLCLLTRTRESIHQWPLLLTWFNFNPGMDK